VHTSRRRRSPAGLQRGATFDESAKIMRALGARDAVNLDGGGSTTITVGGQVVNQPSDATGERPIGDAIVIQR
jgi:exopolysaccharide biosynthesis protein